MIKSQLNNSLKQKKHSLNKNNQRKLFLNNQGQIRLEEFQWEKFLIVVQEWVQ